MLYTDIGNKGGRIMEPTEKRKQLLERANEYKRVPGHGPNFKEMSDEELEKYIRIVEYMFEKAFSEEDE